MRVNLKSSQKKKKFSSQKIFCNFVWLQMVTRVIVIILWHIHIVNHLCCTPEIDILLYANCTSIKKKEKETESVKIRIFTSGNVKLDNFDLWTGPY